MAMGLSISFSKRSRKKPAIMPQPAKLLSLSTAVPGYLLDQKSTANAAAGLFAVNSNTLSEKRLRQLFENTAIERRYSCVPLEWYLEPHGFGARNDLYLENALILLREAAQSALAEAGLTATTLVGNGGCSLSDVGATDAGAGGTGGGGGGNVTIQVAGSIHSEYSLRGIIADEIRRSRSVH